MVRDVFLIAFYEEDNIHAFTVVLLANRSSISSMYTISKTV